MLMHVKERLLVSSSLQEVPSGVYTSTHALSFSHRIPEMSGVSVHTLASALGFACSPITCGVTAYQTELS